MGERFKSKFFLSPSNFWFVPYRDRDNFPKNDDLFPIGVFPIGTEQRSAWDRDTVPENFRSRGLASRIFQSPGLSRIFLSRGTRVPADF